MVSYGIVLVRYDNTLLEIRLAALESEETKENYLTTYHTVAVELNAESLRFPFWRAISKSEEQSQRR